MNFKFLTEKLRIPGWLVLLLSLSTIALIVMVLYLKGIFSGDIAENFVDPVQNADARAYIKKHRNSVVFREQTNVITYDPGELSDYLKTKLTGIIKQIVVPKRYDSNLYKWYIGFYPMHRRDEKGDIRLDFLVIPTYGKKDNSTLIDFRDSTEYTKANPDDRRGVKASCPTCLGYDAGHLWP